MRKKNNINIHVLPSEWIALQRNMRFFSLMLLQNEVLSIGDTLTFYAFIDSRGKFRRRLARVTVHGIIKTAKRQKKYNQIIIITERLNFETNKENNSLYVF